MGICRTEVTILVQNSREERFRQEVNLAHGLAQKHNHQIGNHHKEVARVGCRVKNRCIIDSGSTVASSYAPMQHLPTEILVSTLTQP
jgi:hypothetical protein